MRKILKGNLDCIGCPNYHVTKNGKVYSNYKGKGWVKLSLNRIKNNGYVIVSMLVYKYIKKRKRYEKDFERTHSMEG